MIKNRKKFIIIITGMLICFGLGTFFDELHTYSDSPIYKFGLFKSALQRKEHKAEKLLSKMWQLISEDKSDSVKMLDYGEDEIAYFLFEDNSLVFWSDNLYDIASLRLSQLQNDEYVLLQNTHCILKKLNHGNTKVVALIKIKNNYNYENDYLKNVFAKDFTLGKNIDVQRGSSEDNYAVFSDSGTYLFSLVKKQKKEISFSDYLSIFFWGLGILLFFSVFAGLELWFGKRVYLLRYFLVAFASFSVLTFLALYFNFPKVIFSLKLFSPLYYGSGRYLSSLGHLMILTILFIVSIAVFYFKVYIKPPRSGQNRRFLWLVLVQLFSLLFFLLIYWMFSDLMRNSSFQIVFSKIQELSIYSFFSFLLIGLWFTSFILFRNKTVGILGQLFGLRSLIFSDSIVLIFFLLYGFLYDFYFVYVAFWYFALCLLMNVVRYRNKNYFTYSALITVVSGFAFFVVWHSFNQDAIKKNNRYQIMSDHLFVGHSMSRDFVVETVLNQVDKEILSDNNIKRYVESGDISNGKITRYLSKYYFQTISSNYEIKSFICPKNTISECRSHYSHFYRVADRLDSTRFYNASFSPSLFDYLGVYDFVQYNGDTSTLYIEVFPKNHTDYSYPNLLLADPNKMLPLKFSAAKYVNHTLFSSSGEFIYPSGDEWIQSVRQEKIFYNTGYLHYIYPKTDGSDVIVIVSERRFSLFWSFMFYLNYLLSFYLIISLLFYIYWRKMNHIGYQTTIFNHLVRSLMIFFIVGITFVFTVILYFEINQVSGIRQKERSLKVQYIKRMLHDLVKEENNLSKNMIQADFILQDLSGKMKTDIHLYNLNGELVSTSRPIIFLSGFTSRLMNPDVYFRVSEADDLVLSESIGELNYHASYSLLRNAKGELLGYICVPTFESVLDMRIEVFNFLAIAFNLYLILVFLSLFVSFLLAKRIGLPIKSIEEKLKTIRIGKKNEKIEYKSIETDEIAELIAQYNIMVDELAYSAEMLAKTERELAWKQMARQIAHEIKNPLTPMKLTVQQLQRMKANGSDKFDSYFDKSTGVLIEAIENLSRISSEFSDFASIPKINLLKMDLVERLSFVVELYRSNNDRFKIEFQSTVPNAFIVADSVHITQIFNNLIKNAIQSIPPEKEGEVKITVYTEDDLVLITVSDNGTGIPKDIQSKIFLPNFTTKSSGLGFGLAIVKNMVNMSNGEISFTTREGEGSTFILNFPLVQ